MKKNATQGSHLAESNAVLSTFKKCFWLSALLLLPFVGQAQTPQPLPFTQNWSNTSLITVDDDWSGVPGIIGFRGDNLTAGTGTDPQTLLAADAPGVIDVLANLTSANNNTGGVAEFDLHSNREMVALQGSGTADAPYIRIGIVTSGKSNIRVQYNLIDLDTVDNSIQQVALQYRIGNAGSFTNVPAAYVADATNGPISNYLTTAVDVFLPAACNNQAEVQLRIMTSNAVGNDEWVGIDDIVITAGPCDITSVTFQNASACNDNGTPNNPADDYFTVNIIAAFVNPPTTDSLRIELGGDILTGGGATNVSVVGLSSPHTFTGVRARADGTGTVAEVEFTAVGANCVQTAVGPAVASCAAVCDITSVTFQNASACNDNGTPNNPADDYFTVNIIAAFVNPPATDSLRIELGGDILTGGGATNVSVVGLTSPHTFTGVRAKADGTPTVAEVEFTAVGANCVQTAVGPTVASCSNACDPDLVDPVFNGPLPQDTTVSCDAAIPPFPTLTAFDFCDNSVTVLPASSITLGTCPQEYFITRSWIATDDSGNEAFYDYTITVVDTTAPVLAGVPANVTLSCETPEPPAPVVTATDNCDPNPFPSAISGIALGDCPGEYFISRSWTFVDACGNAASASQLLTFVDITPPSITCPAAVSVSCVTDVPAQSITQVTASDLCSSAMVTFVGDQTVNQTCPNRFTINRTYRATDECGNSATCSQQIVVNDQIPPTFNGMLPANLTLSCSNALPLPAVLTGIDNCPGSGTVPSILWINEFHYDNVGTDVGEFIEIAGTAGLNLSAYQIVLYNGNGGVQYGTLTLSGIIDNENSSGFGALSFTFTPPDIQNGSPDGFALVQISNGMVLQFLSYEGTFQATNGPAVGMFSTDVGVAETATTPIGASLHLIGSATGPAGFTWAVTNDDTPGDLNAGQTVLPSSAAIQAVFAQTSTPGSCAGSRIVTRTYTITDVCGNSAVHTQVLTVNDTDAPVLTPAPANVTVACTAIPTAPAVIATDACDPAGIVDGPVWINELHYDNVGGDVGEFIEVAGRTGTNLAGYTIFLYNGNGGGAYGQTNLSGIIPNLSNGFGAIAFNYPPDGLQNGAPDGFALVKAGVVVQFLSYEGTFVAVGGPANGMLSTDIGVSEPGSDPVGLSLRLTGNGATAAAFVWNNPNAAFPATPGAINQGQTFPAQPPVGLPITFTETTAQPVPNCANRTITRTWSATDACGNAATHTQIITVQDLVGPVVTCQPTLTVNLNICGEVTVTNAQISYTAVDNCSPTNSLVLVPNSVTFDCDDDGGTFPFVTSVQDPCGNTGTCTTQVTIPILARCTPAIATDGCVCKDNATTLTNGQFNETIRITSLSCKTWTIIANSGLYSTNSPNPPAAPVLVALGTLFTESPANSGNFSFTGVHVDAIGYSITVQSEDGEILTISNACLYPNPVITSNLDGPFCLYSDPVTLTGNPGDANIVSQGFTVNGTPATVFNPGNGLGQFTIRYTVNGGVPKAFGPNDPGCIQWVEKIVLVVATPPQLACNDFVQISLDEDCITEVTPDMILEGSYACFDDYTVTITGPNGVPNYGNIVTGANIGQTLKVTIKHLVSGNTCWGNITVEDKLAPQLTCTDVYTFCAVPQYSPAYLQSIGLANVFPVVDENCSVFNLNFADTWFDLGCDDLVNGQSGISSYVRRVWTATDPSGNQSSCTQFIYFQRISGVQVTFPSDVTVSCTNGATTPATTGTPFFVPNPDFPSVVFPLYPNSNYCELNIVYTDQILPVCDGTYKILRTWTLLDWCEPISVFPPYNPIYYIQLIKVEDNQGPLVACPTDITVNTNPFDCESDTNLPDVFIEDACSRINNIVAEYQVDGITYTVNGSLTDFPGNNHWDPDTLGVLGFANNLPLGSTDIKYIVTDDCGNSTVCDFEITVEDLAPPAAVCDEFTQVSIGINGSVLINASTFDDGSYDNCSAVEFKVRRMDVNPCQEVNKFHDQVRLCCSDVGDTITVIFRVYDVDVPDGDISLDFEEEHSNECMVQIFVDDKLKPVCTPPANVTVSCENFDPSLWAYGFATAADNCCVDTVLVTNILTNFDTTCNKGTITRRYTAVDCYGLTSTCTQRIVVQYEQDYYVRFPNDKLLFACDSSFFDQPTFFGEDCELLAVSYQDELFTVVPDACYKIERTWSIINWCTYNPNMPCIYVPNPNPNVNVNSPQNLPGPVVSAPGTTGAWAPTVVRINPTDPTTTNFSIFWEANANCYQYKQIIKVIDNEDPVVANCPASPVEVCDLTPNDPLFWNEMFWWDNTIGSHDLCEAPTDLTITATDACAGENINIRYLLFLDLDQNGTMETVISSTNLPGFNNVKFDNFNTPNYTGGIDRAFDGRPVGNNQKFGFALQTTANTAAGTKTAAVRWNTFQSPNNYVVPQLPYGTHKIKWIVEDGCGNETICEYVFTVKDCKAPTVVCLNGLSVNIMPTQMIQLWASDFLQYTEDNCTPTDQIKIGIRRKGAGTGFPTNPDGSPQTGVTFTCADLGTQFVELWGEDVAGNADYCETYIIIQDNAGFCNSDNVTVAGDLTTEGGQGLEDGQVNLTGSHPALPPISMFGTSGNNGDYMFSNAVPKAADFTIDPTKDDDHLNGVSTFDLVLINKHILGIETFDSPYKIIAADANNSKSVTTFDIAEIRKLILGIYTELPQNESWRFVDAAYSFPNPDNPFVPAFPESKSVADVQFSQIDEDFISMKIGDVNGSAIANSFMSTDDRTAGTLLFDVEDRQVKAGEEVLVNFKAAEKVTAYQFTMTFNGMEVLDLVPGADMTMGNFGVFADVITTSFDADVQGAFSVKFRATKDGKLSSMLGVSSRVTKAEAYSPGGDHMDVALRFNGNNGSIVNGLGFELYQNQPNPFVSKTVIGFHLPEATEATLTVYDETGRMIYTQQGDFAKGNNAITLDRAQINTIGVLYYKLETATDSASKKMIQTK